MNNIEILLVPILVIVYGAVCYMCGKGDLLNVIVLVLQDKVKQLEEKLKDTTEEDGE